METVTQALEKFNIEKAAAAHVKKECGEKYNPGRLCGAVSWVQTLGFGS